MGLFAAVAQAQAGDLAGIQLEYSRGINIVGDNNRRLTGEWQRLLNTLQMAQRALQNIVDIDITGLQIGVIQLTILLAELHQHLMPRPFRRALFGEQAIVGGIKQIFIVEQGVMTGEDRRDIGVKFVFRQLGERIEIGQRLVDRLAQALLLAGDVGGGGSAGWIGACG